MFTTFRVDRHIAALAMLLMSALVFPQSGLAQATTSAYAEGRAYRDLFAESGMGTHGYTNTTFWSSWSLSKNSSSHKIVYDVPNSNPAQAYVLDVQHNDIRSEGMSYGMYIAVLQDDKETFDKLWRFALKRTRQSSGWFAWQTSTASPYSAIDTNPAPDGEEYFATALFLAHGRWGSTSGDLNYVQYANDVLDVLRTQLFDPTSQLIYFSPATSTKYTDPSYHVPFFYELWALWADSDNDFWRDAAAKSRAFLKKAAHSTTGLFPEYADFSGAPMPANTNGNPDSGRFAYDSWRVIQNIALDYHWWSRDADLKKIVERQQAFYRDQNFSYMNRYELNGAVVGTDKSRGHVWMNAVSGLVSPIFGGYDGAPGENDIGWDLVDDAFRNYWEAPTGDYRYYDGVVRLLGLAHAGGQLQIYGPVAAGSSGDFYPNLMDLAQPTLFIRNATGKSLTNFKAKYFFTVESGKTPIVEDVSTPNASVSLQQIKGSQWAAVLNYSGFTLASGAQAPASGNGSSFRIRYTDGSTLDKSNDYSQPKGSGYTSTLRIAVYDSAGKLVMGSEPGALPTAPSTASLKSAWSGRQITATSSQSDAETRGQPVNAGWSSQDWIAEPVTGTSYVRLRNLWNGKYLNVQTQAEGAKVVTYDSNPSWQSQHWAVMPIAGTNTARLRNVWSGRYLTLVDASNYSPVVSRTLNTGWTSQVWTLQ